MTAAYRTSASGSPERDWVLVPVKDFNAAKGRLAATIEPAARAELARSMATHVVGAQRDTPVAICCDDDEVAEWAKTVGARVIWCPGTDLNGAVQLGYETLSRERVRSIAIAHSDLPLATDLAPLFGWRGLTIVPDRHRSGTNVLVVPGGLSMTFAYGAGSFRRHVDQAMRLGRGLRIVHDAALGWDIDEPDDLGGADSTRPYLEGNRP